MKKKPEDLFSIKLSQLTLLYGNDPLVIDFLAHEFLPGKEKTKVADQEEILQVSRTHFFEDGILFDKPKIYIVENVTDKFLPIIQGGLEEGAHFILVGKNLKTSSKIVQHINSASHGVAVGVYAEDYVFLSRYIFYALSSYKVGMEAVDYILQSLRAFPLVVQFCKNANLFFQEGDSITQEAALKLMGDKAEENIFKFADLILAKNSGKLMRDISKMRHFFDVSLVRILMNQFRQLLILKEKTLEGSAASIAVNSYVPPIHFSRRQGVLDNLQRWSYISLVKALIQLDELEILMKSPSQDQSVALERKILSLLKA